MKAGHSERAEEEKSGLQLFCFCATKEVNRKLNTLKRLISPPSVGEEDAFLSMIWLSQLDVYGDKEISPVGRINQMMSLVWLNSACTD